MSFIIHFAIGFITSFLGTTPPSMLNMTTTKITLEKTKKEGLKFAIGVSIIVLIQAYIAVLFAKYIHSNENFEWYKDDLIIEGEVSEKYTPTALGVYYCKITNTGFPDLVLTTNNVTVINNDYPSRIISTTFNIDENSPNESLVGLVLTEDEDVRLLRELIIYGVKGLLHGTAEDEPNY